MTRRVSDDQTSWGTLHPVRIHEHPLDVWGAEERHRTIICETLSKIPPGHLSLIPRIVVGDIVGMGTVTRGGNSVNRPPHLRLELTVNALNDPRKLVPARAAVRGGNIHITILHETGHHVDWHGSGGGLRRGLTQAQQQAILTWFETVPYRGRTQDEGEARAEMYWRLYANSTGNPLPRPLMEAVCRIHGIPL